MRLDLLFRPRASLYDQICVFRLFVRWSWVLLRSCPLHSRTTFSYRVRAHSWQLASHAPAVGALHLRPAVRQELCVVLCLLRGWLAVTVRAAAARTCPVYCSETLSFPVTTGCRMLPAVCVRWLCLGGASMIVCDFGLMIVCCLMSVSVEKTYHWESGMNNIGWRR